MSERDCHDALLATLVDTNPRETIRPKAVETWKGRPDGTVQLPPGEADHVEVDERGLAKVAPRLVLGRTIGEGGMAIVRLAKQVSLGRDVAVKTVRDETAGHGGNLLREAWITGALEHPNIVPIHDLGTDESGRPMLVLKRIEGRPWSELIDRPAELRAAHGMDPLDWNVQQLVQVCHAVAFAHSRGIVHRDLKPANIMIGGFGEVYVLDWGIAVSLVDDGSGRLPLAAEARDIAGTLAYMAPEMLGGEAVTERTDVYLLGSILYELMTGDPPHIAESVASTLASIVTLDRRFPPELPDELVAICRRAMACAPADRFASAEALRSALVGFLAHRGSTQIAQEAHARMEALEAHLRAAAADRVIAYQLFGQCRFGFQAALRTWPENAAAKLGLDRALISMTTYELDQGDARAASLLLAELSAPPPALVARLAELEREVAAKARHVESLERLGVDRDAALGSRVRTAFLVMLGLAWATVPLAAGLFPAIEVDHQISLIVTGVSLAIAAAFTSFAREAMMKTALNRGVVQTVFVALVLHGVVEGAAWGLGLDMVTTHLLAIAVWTGACGVAAVFLDRALLVPTLGFMLALVAAVLSPAQRLWAIAGSCGVLLTTVVYVWHGARHGRRTIAGLADLLRAR